MLEAAGARVTRFPVLEIREPRDPAPFRAALQALEHFDIAVFVSANAVWRVVPTATATTPWPRGLKIAAIGARTARELRDLQHPPDIVPAQRFDSEALLAEPGLQTVTGQRVVIFRGDGGRAHLGETLRARGAVVTYVEAYRRALPEGGPEPLVQAWDTEGIDAITVTSGESLRMLEARVGPAALDRLRQTPLIVGGPRVAALAQERGFSAAIETADDPTDAAMLRALLRWHRRGAVHPSGGRSPVGGTP